MTRSRSLLLSALLGLGLLALGLPGCSAGDDRDPSSVATTGRLVEVTPRALAAVAVGHLGGQLEGVHVDPRARSRWPGCPGYRRVLVEVDLRGADVHLGMPIGTCRRADLVRYTCSEGGAGAPLRGCTREELEDGSVVVAGVHEAWEEGTYRVAVRRAEGWEAWATVRVDQDRDVPLDELVAVVSDPALGPRVDAAYASAGRDLPSGGEHPAGRGAR